MLFFDFTTCFFKGYFAANIPKPMEIAIHAGAVYGVSTEILTGRTIAGMALGMRGTFPSGLFYDTFISRALYKPDGFHTKTWAGGFTLGCQF